MGRYPRPDPDYQKFYYEQVTLAKNRIAHFSLANKLLDNFKNYEDLNYRQTRNKIFLSCIHRVNWFDPNILNLDGEKNPDLKPIKYFTNYLDYPDYVELLEKSLYHFNILGWKQKEYNLFKNRIANHDWSVSSSAFSEITTAFRLAMKLGTTNVQYEPSISNGKNSDILVHLDGKDIYLELSFITESKTGKKIQAILDDVAKYFYCKIKTKNHFQFVLKLDTTKLVFTNGHIDEEKSKKKVFAWIDKLNMQELAGFNGILFLDEYRYHSGIIAYSKKSLIDYPWNRPDMRQLLKEQEIVRNWASKVTISDALLCPIVSIGGSNKDPVSFVEIDEDSMYSTHEELVNSNQMSSIETGKLQEDSFLSQIFRKISYKIREEQYERGNPVIFMIYARLWSNSYETDSDDLLRIEKIVKKALEPYPYVSGVLLYYDDYTSGKFIHNPNADSKVNLTESELSTLFT